MFEKEYPKEVTLTDGRTVVMRPLEKGDFDRLCSFFQSLSPDERRFLRHDVGDREMIRKWVEELDFARVIPIIALEGDRIVADATLHVCHHGWMQHVGHVRLVLACSHRNVGLDAIIVHELVVIAESRGLEKLQCHVIEDNAAMVRMFEQIGFEKVAVLKDLVKDANGVNRNLAIMINDVSNLEKLMEDWILDSMLPAYRAPGEG